MPIDNIQEYSRNQEVFWLTGSCLIRKGFRSFVLSASPPRKNTNKDESERNWRSRILLMFRIFCIFGFATTKKHEPRRNPRNKIRFARTAKLVGPDRSSRRCVKLNFPDAHNRSETSDLRDRGAYRVGEDGAWGRTGPAAWRRGGKF